MKKDWDYLDKKLEQLGKEGKTCCQCSELNDCGIADEPKTDINTDVCTDFSPPLSHKDKTMKKLSKEKKLKERIAELEENYDRIDKQNDEMRAQLRDYKEKEEREQFQMKTFETADFRYSEKLTTIIKWLINPESAAKELTEEEIQKIRRF